MNKFVLKAKFKFLGSIFQNGVASILLFCTMSGIVEAEPLRLAPVTAPQINCVFDLDCRVTVNDSSDEVVLEGVTGSGFLQSRTLPPGEAGTPAAGFYAYEYRIDLRQMSSSGDIANCIRTLTIPFGDVIARDYDGDGRRDHIYMITSGGMGTVRPTSAEQLPDGSISFGFGGGVCGTGGVSSVSFAVKSIIFEITRIRTSVLPSQNTNTFLFSFHEAPFVSISIFREQFSVTIFLSVSPLTVVLPSVCRGVNTFPVSAVVSKTSYIHITIRVLVCSRTVHFVFVELAFVNPSI